MLKNKKIIWLIVIILLILAFLVFVFFPTDVLPKGEILEVVLKYENYEHLNDKDSNEREVMIIELDENQKEVLIQKLSQLKKYKYWGRSKESNDVVDGMYYIEFTMLNEENNYTIAIASASNIMFIRKNGEDKIHPGTFSPFISFEKHNEIVKDLFQDLMFKTELGIDSFQDIVNESANQVNSEVGEK